MYSIIFTALLSLSANFSTPLIPAEVAPVAATFESDQVDVLELTYEKVGSDVSITLILHVEDTVLSLSSVSHSYVEASENLKSVIQEVTNK